jgi:hypothetical protein
MHQRKRATALDVIINEKVMGNEEICKDVS